MGHFDGHGEEMEQYQEQMCFSCCTCNLGCYFFQPDKPDSINKLVFYSGYLWKGKEDEVPKASDCRCNSCLENLILFMVASFVAFPYVWFIGTFFINLYERLAWHFDFPYVLWFVYGISTFSAVLDSICNCAIIWHCKRSMVVFNMPIDFAVIIGLLTMCLWPLMAKEEINPDDEQNNTLTELSVNLFDSFAILALTASNMTLNNLVGAVLKAAIVDEPGLYYAQIEQALKTKGAPPKVNVSTDNASGNHKSVTPGVEMQDFTTDQQDTVCDEENRPATATSPPGPATSPAAADTTTTTTNGKVGVPPPTIKTLLQKVTGKSQNFLISKGFVDKQHMQQLSELLVGMTENFKFSEEAKSVRFWLRMKMVLNILSVTMFAFYANVYLNTSHGSYVFVLFLTVLSFCNNSTSSACIKIHDTVVGSTFNQELFTIPLVIGDLNGIINLQFYYTVVLSLVNVILRAAVVA